jgi:uncharacterized protein YcnI
MRSSTITTVVLLLLLLLPGPALGHAGLMPGELAPGVVTEGELVVVHGCGPDGTIPANDDEEYATTAVVLERPAGLTIAPHPVEGWSMSTSLDEAGEVAQVRWETDDPAGELGAIFLGVEVTADPAPDGTEIWVPVVQECAEGEELRWLAEQVETHGGPLPAMRVTVDGAVLAATATSSDGPPLALLIAVVLAVALAAGGGVAYLTARRS